MKKYTGFRIPIWLLLVALPLFLVPGTAAAASYTIEHSHSQGYGGISVSFNSGSSYASTYLGRFIMEPITPLPAGYPTYPISTVHGNETGFFSYCLEPLQGIGTGHGPANQYSFTIGTLVATDGIDAAEGNLISELFGRYNPLLQYDPIGPYTGGNFRTAAAALQLAIWKINLDYSQFGVGWSFSSGLVRVGAITPQEGASLGINAVALLMLNSLTGSGPMASGLEGLRSGAAQDLMIQNVSVPDGGTTAALLGMSMLALGWFRRNRN